MDDNDRFNPADVRSMIPNRAGHSHEMPVFGVNQEIVATQGALGYNHGLVRVS